MLAKKQALRGRLSVNNDRDFPSAYLSDVITPIGWHPDVAIHREHQEHMATGVKSPQVA